MEVSSWEQYIIHMLVNYSVFLAQDNFKEVFKNVCV